MANSDIINKDAGRTTTGLKPIAAAPDADGTVSRHRDQYVTIPLVIRLAFLPTPIT
jgi:hypothetical protein